MRGMPTTRRRHLITETDEVARALDDAAKRWPADSHSRPKLILHLLHEGHRAVSEQVHDRLASRQEAVAQTSGALTGAYGDGYLTQLRGDWPA